MLRPVAAWSFARSLAVVVSDDSGLPAIADQLGDFADDELSEISMVFIDAHAASYSTG